LKTAIHVSGRLNDPVRKSRGWTVEMAFPWEGFAHDGYRARKPAEGEQWRINFSRVEWQTRVVNGKIEKVPDTKEDNWVWSPQGRVNMHLPEFWGYVQFGGGPFRADATWEARMRVQDFYERQVLFKKQHGRWAASKEELGVTDAGLVFEARGAGWKASAGGVTITDDARISMGM
jgi:hypothetical protein